MDSEFVLQAIEWITVRVYQASLLFHSPSSQPRKKSPELVTEI